jgi:gelsolin
VRAGRPAFLKTRDGWELTPVTPARPDESGSAAYFTVNIDDMLNGKPVQHRETQGSESALFQSYFGSITYLDGGCASGFKTVEPTAYKPRLLLIKGALGKVRVSQVPLQAAAITHGDVFILGTSQTNAAATARQDAPLRQATYL